jgi:serine protease Do
MQKKIFARSAIAAAALAVTAGAWVQFGGANGRDANAAMVQQQQPAQAVASTVPGMATATDFSGIVQRYGPAVVNISVLGKAQQSPAAYGGPGLDPDDPFSDFLRRFGPQMPRAPQGGQIMRGLGSGFIVSPDGVIITNAHVVDGAEEVIVRLTDRREYKAKVLGVDKQTDIAAIKIDARDLPTVKLGDPAAAQVGEPVLAIGSPYGFENTATAGIISAKSRSLPEDTYVPFIQTDVAVNPGNSGGPLFNLKGEVIGVNSQIYSRTGGYQGLSFAIPINVAANVKDQLIKHGKVTRGRLGVGIQEVTHALADSFGLKGPQGALVSSVDKGSPAERAGLEPGDVIVRFNGRDVNRSADLPALVADARPGARADIDVIRKGAPKTLSATIGEMKETAVAQRGEAPQDQGRLGMAVRPLDREEQRQAGVSGGLVVEGVSGPAARSGIQPGDIILSLNGAPAASVEQLRAAVSKADKHIAVLVQRDTARIFVPIELG